MARWKALPEGLDPIVVQFVAELRKMKDDSGLSLGQLAKRTGYSASSWERYLGGRAPAPAEAVRALIGIVGADETGRMVLHQAAQEAWAASGSGDGDTEPETDTAETDPSSPAEPTAVIAGAGQTAASQTARRPASRTVVNSLVSALVGAAVTVLVLQPWHHDQASSTTVVAAASHASPTPTPTHAVQYSCTFSQTGGEWYAGNSSTAQDLVTYDMTGPTVAEVQCLLQHDGISPGGIDGQFGPKTLKALLRLQVTDHLDVDGQVGPQTWAALRR